MLQIGEVDDGALEQSWDLGRLRKVPRQSVRRLLGVLRWWRGLFEKKNEQGGDPQPCACKNLPRAGEAGVLVFEGDGVS